MMDVQELRDRVEAMPRQTRLLLVAALTLLLTGAAWRLWRPAPLPVAGGPAPAVSASGAPLPVAATVAAAAPTPRDPFAVPAQYIPPDMAAPATATPGSGAASGRPASPLPPSRRHAGHAAPAAAYVLCGVVSGDNGRQAAIIETADGSRVYRVGERVGAYTLTEITTAAAVLDGPAGRMTLAVRR